ncbi:acyltransferase [Xinfangfangia sp. CPCC 101601]|uniref:Acyltransferase n=1 Tax=Pseudogemmobacter lacusdianii TaxID=3069608 RepID=A0ABU0VUW5_9RHOB|nr:acyltransferase [Xinfangfangia sp. CPCC 101601]MDQ2065524.1 acyltransferase [Xinfangfangia sp. CPCC 101601]
MHKLIPADPHYRAEIDGLRCLAVMAVVLAHAGWAGLPGGFLGVDIFFVISGFLITQVLSAERAEGRVSLKQFYARRMRRLMPALVVMLTVSLVLGCLVLIPSELRELGVSGAATLLFLSNFYFMDATDYFAATTLNLPLIHTWSLGIEEQFYLVFPLLFLIPMKAALRWGLIVILALASLALANYGADIKPSSNYFFSPSRAWELLAGAAIAGLRRGSAWGRGMDWAGLALL